MDAIKNLVITARQPNNTERHCAFEQLVRQFQNFAYGCAYGVLGDFHLAQDVAQDAFLTAYKDLDKLQDPKAFPGWFKQIVVRKAYRLKKVYSVLSEPVEENVTLSSPEPDQSQQLEKQDEARLVHRAIENLPEHERTVTALFYLTDYSQQKIADFLDLPLTTVKKRLQRAREHLKDRMLTMVENTFENNRPDKDDQFTSEVVDIITATENDDLSKIAALIARNPALMDADAPLSDAYPIQARGWKPLHIAAWHGHDKAIEFLLDQGADINAQCSVGRTPLHYAIEAAGQNTRNLLIEKGAETDIYVAAILGMTDRVKALLIQNPSLANDTSIGTHPLEWATWGGQLEIVKLLVDHGADPIKCQNYVSFTATANGSLDILSYILGRGADPNAQSQGRSLLHVAIEMRYVKDNTNLITVLIEHGANINALNDSGQTPLDIALGKGTHHPDMLNPKATSNEDKAFDQIIALLKSHGAKTAHELATS